MRAVWKGHLLFHTFKLPVKIYPAVRKQDKLLHSIHKKCHSRIEIEKKCPIHGVISPNETAKGYQMEDGQYIVINRTDLLRIKPLTSRQLKITHFFPKSYFDPIDFINSYFIIPQKTHQVQYALLRESLLDSGLYGIGKIFIKQHEREAVIWVKNQLLALSTIRGFDEQAIEQTLNDKLEEIHFNKSEIQQTVQLVRQNLSNFSKLASEDRFREKLIDLLGEKVVRIASDYELDL